MKGSYSAFFHTIFKQYRPPCLSYVYDKSKSCAFLFYFVMCLLCYISLYDIMYLTNKKTKTMVYLIEYNNKKKRIKAKNINSVIDYITQYIKQGAIITNIKTNETYEYIEA